MNKYIHYLNFQLALILTLCISTVSGQDTTNVIGSVSIASPTAASLGKYGDYPISLNTGTPQITIPFYSISAGSLKLPVGMSYHASGLKVQENASWVGAGWSLNAGGVITRTVLGRPDDRGISSHSNCQYGYYSDYGYNSYEFRPGSGDGAVNGMVADDQSFEQGVKDGEPDLYFFNFGEYSGKFYFNDDRTPIIVPEQDFKIEPDLNNATNGFGFQGFIVTTPDGVKYYFGLTGNHGPVSPLEITVPSTLQNGADVSNQAVSSWFLNKIVSRDCVDSITLTYVNESYSYYALSMYPITNLLTQDVMGPSNTGYSVTKNFVQGVRLTGISFPNGSITFLNSATPRTDLSDFASQGFADRLNTESYALGNIQISDNQGFCKKYSMYYGYFFDSNPYTLNSGTYGGFNIQSDMSRLRLDSIKEQTCDASILLPPYKFSYFPELVPRKLSFGIDHWGYSNGVTTNQGVIPTYTHLNGNAVDIMPGANRDASWPAMRGGALQQITYPTGGYSRFDFEAHDTYVQYNTYKNINVGSTSIGFDNPNPHHFTFTTDVTSSIFRVDMNSTNQIGGGDNLELADPSGTVVVNIHINGGTSTIPNTSTTQYFTLSPSTTYTATLFESPSSPGTANLAIYEQLATSIAGNMMVGGLRIKTSTLNDGMTINDQVKTYTYNTGGSTSSGILYSRPVYVQTIRNIVWGWVYGSVGGSLNGCVAPDFLSGNGPLGSGGTYYMSGGSVTPMSTMQGNHIGYNQVQESENGNGYSIYRYYGSNVWDNQITDVCTRVINTTLCLPTIPNFPAPPEPFEFGRGDLKYEGHFSQGGSILKDATYSTTYTSTPIVTPGVLYITIPGLYSFTPYSLQSAKKIKSQVVSTSYDPANSASLTSINTIYYGSPFHHEATRTVSSTSTGDSLINTVKYAFDFRIPTCDGIPDSLPFYISAIQADSGRFFSRVDSCCSTVPGNWVCRYDTFQLLRRNVNLARIQYINYRRRSYSDPNNLLASCYLNALIMADPLLKPILRLRSEFDNASLEVSQHKNLNLSHANFTQYDTSQNPIGFAYPGRTQLLNLQTLSSTFTSANVAGSTITRDSRYVDESFYSFASGNPQQILARDGVQKSYIWDYNNKEPIAKVTNSAANQIAYTSFEADGNGNWTIPSLLRDAGSITGSKSYNLTNGPCSRSGLISANSYVVSYWSKSGSAFTVTGSMAIKQGKTISIGGSSWTYFEHIVTGTISVSVSGLNDIDELRLYPANAQMLTYCYKPLLGMVCQCDADNRIIYYEYDSLGRLQDIKDQDGNIVKTYEYHYKGQ